MGRTVNEVAEMFRVKPLTIRRWIKDGRLKIIQPFPGAKILIEDEEIERFKKEGAR